MSTMPQPTPEPSGEAFDWELELDLQLAEGDDLLFPMGTLPEDQTALDRLFDQGFTWEEGLRLLAMRERRWELPEVRERLEADPHLGFARWLYAQGRLES